MADTGDIIEVIKQAALNAVETSQPCKFVFGTVLVANPLKIKVQDKLILPADHLTLTRNVTKFSTKAKLGNDSEKTITIDNSLKYGDKVVLIKNKGANGYLVLDRVVRAK